MSQADALTKNCFAKVDRSAQKPSELSPSLFLLYKEIPINLSSVINPSILFILKLEYLEIESRLIFYYSVILQKENQKQTLTQSTI